MRRLPLLLFIFALSGVSALVFETLWFRQAGLMFGNSVWASSLVLSSFMAGLAIGNGLGARFGDALDRPLLVYAALEVAIAASGVALLLLLPALAGMFAPLFRPFLDWPELLQPLRFAVAFLLLVLPATAMGATLPVLLCAAYEGQNYGSLLGRLYGWNTLGAMIGAVLSEALLVPRIGIFASGCVAGALNLVAAAVVVIALRRSPTSRARAPAVPLGTSPLAPRLLAASFLAGGILLALEVVWFRLLVLFLTPSDEAFAWMLAVVLLGIGAGGLLTSLWLRTRPSAPRYVTALALASGAAALACYAAIGPVERATAPWGGTVRAALTTRPLMLSLTLMLPTCLLSGALFPLLGKRLHDELGASARATGLIALANTAGSMLGPLLAGFVMLPSIGIARSLFVLSASYTAVALCSLEHGRTLALRLPAAIHGAAAVVLLVAMATFPTARVYRHYLGKLAQRYAHFSEQVISVREGLVETTVYMRADYLGDPYFYRLVTDNIAMSCTGKYAERYMSLFVHLPAALHADLKDALLISYGVGTTARSLADLPSLERIDVVDISPDILEQSEFLFDDPRRDPLQDPRVTTIVEDGRYFLQTTARRYDLITAEPPPPSLAGVSNLYTAEYFALIRKSLRDGGFVSYWLPVWQMQPTHARAITRAFCASFPDCSLWAGSGMEWILLGSNGAVGGLSEEQLAWQWSDDVLAPRLEALGLELPEQLGATFLADASYLGAWWAETAPLVDDRPGRAPRLMPLRPRAAPLPEYAEIMEPHGARRRFEQSALIREFWPEPLRTRSLAYFEYEHVGRQILMGRIRQLRMGSLHRLLTKSDLRTLPLWLLGSDARRQEIALAHAERGKRDARITWELAVHALVHRDFETAAERFAQVRSPKADLAYSGFLEVYALCLADRRDDARERLKTRFALSSGPVSAQQWAFLRVTFGVSAPWSSLPW